MQLPYYARLVALASAIAHAEGFWVPGAIPRRHNNPGDLLDGAGANINFPSRLEGFDRLAHQVALMLEARSQVYHWQLTWREVAQRWTGGDNAAAWCASVCDDLHVAPDSTLGHFADDDSMEPLFQQSLPSVPELPPSAS